MTALPGAHLTVLPAARWRPAEERHRQAVDELTAGHRARAGRGVPHPVEDFLFSYYSLRPAQLRRWYPGAGVALAEAADRARWPFHQEVVARQDIRPDRVSLPSGGDGQAQPRTIDCNDGSDHLGRGGGPVPDDGSHPGANAVTLDVSGFSRVRGRQIDFTVRLLRATAAAPGQFGCFGLHEWAMVFEQDAERRRHASWPLRLGQAGTNEVVRDHQIRCTHYDAFRFFTPPARPRNQLQPDLESRVRLEQPGCLHASMDVYKWAYKLIPAVPSDLLLDAFRLARSIRETDMRASPYDLTDLGYRPIAIETAAGKAEYVAAQREHARSAQVLRRRLLAVLESLPAGAAVAGSTRAAGSPS